MQNGTFDWGQSPIAVARNDGLTYVVDGNHRLQAAILAGQREVPVTDVTSQLLDGGFLGWGSMSDVINAANEASIMGNKLNPYILRRL